MPFDIRPKIEQAEEVPGSQGDQILSGLLGGDEETLDDAQLIAESLNISAQAFLPDMTFENLVKNYSLAKQLYGPTLLRQLTGYSAAYLEKNIRIPEFRKHLKDIIEKRVEKLKQKGFLDKNSGITDTGLLAASLKMYVEELDLLVAGGLLGEKHSKERSIHGEKRDKRPYRKGDGYRQIDIRETVKTALRRGHSSITTDDLRSVDKQKKGKVSIVFCLDASASMKGQKLEACKKAGIALAYKALDQSDEVGLVEFGPKAREMLEPGKDFIRIIKAIAQMKAKEQTDIAESIKAAIELFGRESETRHILLVTDSMPTVGKQPEKETLKAAIRARDAEVTISLIGIKLTKEAARLARKIVDIGQGNLYSAKTTEGLDRIVLQDYDMIKEN
ncbi:MAG: VWA domain-containing protein [Nanoarchaeota archaeon]|nr:VWA domain-containing protein [Nanoarchaeota archaeon]